MNFRTDINGLRAIAVIAVVLFHFDPRILPGGFAGVDIFFVISGYLMTGIIFKGILTNSFNIFKFYIARINRIVPPLTVLCFVLLIFGWFFLIPMDYVILDKHILSSLAFVSNVVYWSESGYFDATSQEKWLLHTWSLSVEWQFYIIYPVALAVLNRLLKLSLIKKLLVFATLSSFLLCVVATMKWPTPAYFILPTRAWEMLSGGLAYLYPVKLKEKNKKHFELLAIFIILASYLLMNSHLPWPGYFSLLPVLGAYLLIITNRQNSVFTDNIVFRHVGKWSYSIYLWHWPLVVLGFYFGIAHWIYFALPLSFLLGFISYRYIESIRFRSFLQWKDLLSVKPIYPLALVMTLGGMIIAMQGDNFLTVRLNKDEAATLKNLQQSIVMAHRGNGYCFYDFDEDKALTLDSPQALSCVLGDKSKSPQTLFFGSSYAGMYDPLLDGLFKNNNASFNSVSTNWCSPILTNNFVGPKTHIAYQQCLTNRRYLQQVIETKAYKTIIIADIWNVVETEGFVADVEDFVRQASEKGMNVVILPLPKAYVQNPIPLYYRELLTKKPINLSTLAVDVERDRPISQWLAHLAVKYPHVYYVPQESVFNQDGLFEMSKAGISVPYTLDGGHLSKIGADNLLKHFEESDYYKTTFQKLINTQDLIEVTAQKEASPGVEKLASN